MAPARRDARPTEITPFGTRGPLSLIEEALGEFAQPAAHVAPADLYEANEAPILEMAAPGLTPEDLEVSLEGDKLTVRGQVRPVGVGGEAKTRPATSRRSPTTPSCAPSPCPWR